MEGKVSRRMVGYGEEWWSVVWMVRYGKEW